ncbi:acyltransferase family protein [Ideonella sp.]|uniref:acyltransferase family protein n=1 Tax=Ideonella sp. TaxID=1929293 RepID=UPI003BB7DBC8
MKRIDSLDGLRGASIALVLLSHAGLGKVVPGGLGVTLFFFISGYIITRLLLQEQDRCGSIDVPAFFARRAFRILPALFVYLLAASLYLHYKFAVFDAPHLLSAILNVYNYYYIFALDHGGAVGNHHPYAIVWSLAVEEHYYLVFPFIFSTLISKPRKLRNLLLIICVITLGWRLYLAGYIGTTNLPAERIYKATDTRIDSIAFGAIYALISTNNRSERILKALRSKHALSVGILLLLLSLTYRNPIFRESLRYTIQGVGIALIFHSLIETDTPKFSLFTNSIVIWLGAVSYSLYLWHWLCLIALENAWPILMSTWIGHLIFVLLSLAVAHLSHRFIERPLLTLGRRWQVERTARRNTAQKCTQPQ